MSDALGDASFDRVVSSVYLAATGGCSWSSALDQVRAVFGARAAILHTLDLHSGHLVALHHGGADVEPALFDHVRGYHRIDPRLHHQHALGERAVDTWLHDHEVHDARFVIADRFYQQYLPALGSRFNATLTLSPSEGVRASLSLELPAERGVLDAGEREFARRLGAHMAHAVRGHERLRRIAAQALAGHGLLDSFVCPMWLVHADRLVQHANPAAMAEETGGTRVARRGTRLLLLDDAADKLLGQRLHALTGGAAADVAHGATAVIDLQRSASDAPTWLALQALQPDQVLGAFGNRMQVLLTLFDPALTRPLDPLALTSLFGLTPAEARVAALLADGLTAKEVARRLGTAPATVRSHQARLLVKLGVARSVEVVSLLRRGEALWSHAGGKPLRERRPAPLP